MCALAPIPSQRATQPVRSRRSANLPQGTTDSSPSAILFQRLSSRGEAEGSACVHSANPIPAGNTVRPLAQSATAQSIPIQVDRRTEGWDSRKARREKAGAFRPPTPKQQSGALAPAYRESAPVSASVM